jgi:hypothetical protein
MQKRRPSLKFENHAGFAEVRKKIVTFRSMRAEFSLAIVKIVNDLSSSYQKSSRARKSYQVFLEFDRFHPELDALRLESRPEPVFDSLGTSYPSRDPKLENGMREKNGPTWSGGLWGGLHDFDEFQKISMAFACIRRFWS